MNIQVLSRPDTVIRYATIHLYNNICIEVSRLLSIKAPRSSVATFQQCKDPSSYLKTFQSTLELRFPLTLTVHLIFFVFLLCLTGNSTYNTRTFHFHCSNFASFLLFFTSSFSSIHNHGDRCFSAELPIDTQADAPTYLKNFNQKTH